MNSGLVEHPERERLLPGEVCGEHAHTQQPVVYTRRYYILVVCSFMIMIQGMVWNTWGPIATSAKAVFPGWTDSTVGLLANWGPITFLINTPLLTWLMDTKGLRWSMLIAISLVVLGTGLRCVPVDTESRTWFIHAGHICNGLAGPVAMGIPPLLSSVLFPAHQRITATAYLTVCMGICIGFGYLLGPFMVPDYIPGADKHELELAICRLLYVEWGIAVFVFVLILLYFPSKPPSPPSVSASAERMGYTQGVKQLLSNRRVWAITLPYALSGGVYSGWGSVLAVILNNRGIGQTEAGKIGFYALLAGCGFSLIFGRFADLFRNYVKLYLIILMSLLTVSVGVFTLAFEEYIPFSKELFYVSVILVGIFMAVPQPLYYEIACDLSYPVAEGLTGGFMSCFNNFITFALLLFLFIPNIGTKWLNWALLGSGVACLPVLLLVNETYARYEMDTTSPTIINDDYPSQVQGA